MRKYKNTVTSAVIETAGVIKGGNWVLVEEVQPTESIQEPAAKKTPTKKTATQKKSGE